ncbi:MAG: restriction endonuclease, partial [Mesorhizobium sp.]
MAGAMTKPFYLSPILNSPYLAPTRHHALSEDGQPLEHPPIEGRRRSKYVTPVPRARKARGKGDREQQDFGFERAADGQAYNPTPIINEIRGHLEAWRSLPNPNDWGVTPTTQRLLQHWRHHDFQSARPFFCQVE